ncbi:hypothetical protein Q5P01_025205 [Channa striata]|uniref:Uncharacterized protein n=1 Tax=Channa striata TaxID=64152 RepID=A0AA88J1L5_CHASR|nr:hypothetical protein Q5P01_025205 [Channa striata]
MRTVCSVVSTRKEPSFRFHRLPLLFMSEAPHRYRRAPAGQRTASCSLVVSGKQPCGRRRSSSLQAPRRRELNVALTTFIYKGTL